MTETQKFSEIMCDKCKGAFKFFGESENGATMITCALSAFKGIFRPIFTLNDKKSDPETKKYAAIRECLTEMIAIPLYIATPWVAGKLVDNVLKSSNPIDNKRMRANAKFIGTCAAVLIIPFVCNVVQPPIMAAIKEHEEAKKAKKSLDVTSVADVQQPVVINKPATPIVSSLQKPVAIANSGMRVGN